jgi:DnaJ like chaperone protein
MGWMGKVVGGLSGFAAGGPIGAVLGALGHGVDRGVQKLADDMQLPFGDRKRIESVFFTATFSTMGHLAKADGRVSEAEIALAEAVMARLQLTGERRSAAIALFRQGKAAGLRPAGRHRALPPRMPGPDACWCSCSWRSSSRPPMSTASRPPPSAGAGGDPRGSAASPMICSPVGEPGADAAPASPAAPGRAGAGADGGPAGKGPTPGQAYAVLGVTPKDSDAAVKRAYRKLLSQHHPDKLVSKGLPEDMIKLATQKTHEIRRAYEMIQDGAGSQFAIRIISMISRAMGSCAIG